MTVGISLNVSLILIALAGWCPALILLIAFWQWLTGTSEPAPKTKTAWFIFWW